MKTEWNFEHLLKKNPEEEKKEIEKAFLEFKDKWKKREDYLEKADILKEALDEYENLLRNYSEGGDYGYYYWLKQEQDENDTEIRAKFGEIEEFSIKRENEIKFFELKISKIPQEKQKDFLEDIQLNDYKHFLEKLFLNSKYLLKEGEEKILSLKNRSSYELWMKMISSLLAKETKEALDEDGKKKIKTYAELMSLMKSNNKKVRDSAAKVFNEILDKYSEIAEFEINAILEHKKVNDEIRNMKRPDTSRHIEDDIEEETVDCLIDTVSERFTISRKYYKLKSKLFNLDKLSYYERSAEYGKIKKEFEYGKTIELIKNVFYSLDEKFGKILDKYLEEGLIDVFPKKGKRSGAFCVHFLMGQPTYILLNYANRLNEILTVAHEVGHGINNEFMKEKQNSLNFGTPKSTAEVASTFMEDFVLEELLKDANEEEKLMILMRKLEDDISTIMRQVACYIFEKELHETYRKEGYLSKGKIGKIFRKNMENYMGEFVDCAGCENWWISWIHPRYYFYVYSYASGLLISKAMQEKVKENPEFIEKVKEFLSAGESKSPKDIFMDMGIDITRKEFWEKGLNKVEKLLEETEELAKKLGKI